MRRLAWGAVGLGVTVLALILLGVLATSMMRLSVPELPRLSEAANSQTGLADGTYVLKPNSMLIAEDGCAFTGTVTTAPSAGAIVVTGTGLAECGMANTGQTRDVPPTADEVEFVVTDGIAQIARLIQAPLGGQ